MRPEAQGGEAPSNPDAATTAHRVDPRYGSRTLSGVARPTGEMPALRDGEAPETTLTVQGPPTGRVEREAPAVGSFPVVKAPLPAPTPPPRPAPPRTLPPRTAPPGAAPSNPMARPFAPAPPQVSQPVPRPMPRPAPRPMPPVASQPMYRPAPPPIYAPMPISMPVYPAPRLAGRPGAVIAAGIVMIVASVISAVNAIWTLVIVLSVGEVYGGIVDDGGSSRSAFNSEYYGYFGSTFVYYGVVAVVTVLALVLGIATLIGRGRGTHVMATVAAILLVIWPITGVITLIVVPILLWAPASSRRWFGRQPSSG